MAHLPDGLKLETISTKRGIDLHAALRSTLRAWLASRDTAVFSLVSGVEAQSGGPILEEMTWEQARASVERMNTLRTVAYDFAAQINERSSESVLHSELDSLLSEESPKFLLRVDGALGSF